MINYSTTEFKLTENEQTFIKLFLANNGCGATTPEELIDDNYSCQCIEDLNECTNYTPSQIAGYLGSLTEKNVIWIEDRDGSVCKSKSRVAQMNFEPDLYWVNESYLESLPKEMSLV